MNRSKRVNKIHERYIELAKNNYVDYDAFEETFEEFSYKKIDYFSRAIVNSLNDIFQDNVENNYILTAYINKLLKDNLYNNNENVFSLMNCIFQMPYTIDDFGMYPTITASFGNIIEQIGWKNYCENYKSLIIEVAFSDLNCCPEQETFQIRCNYEAFGDSEYNTDFEKVFSRNNFLTTHDWFFDLTQARSEEEFVTKLTEKDIEEYPCEDYLQIHIIDMNNYGRLSEELKPDEEVKDMVDKFKNSIKEVEELIR